MKSLILHAFLISSITGLSAQTALITELGFFKTSEDASSGLPPNAGIKYDGNNNGMLILRSGENPDLIIAPGKMTIGQAGTTTLAPNSVTTEKLIAKEISIQTDLAMPDYVFSKDYDLVSLDSLEKFISAESHLPNIPSAAEVDSAGIDLVDLNLRLLQKVEEMTLYIIDQEKRLRELEQNNNVEN